MPEGFKSTGKSKIIIFSFLGAVLLALSILSFTGFFIWNMYLQNNINNLNQEINALPKPETLISQNKLNKLESLLNNHVYWLENFKSIEDLTLKNIYFSNFSGNAEKKEIILKANLPSYSVLSKQIKSFEQGFSKVDFQTQGIAKQGGLNISINLQNVDLSKN